MSHAWPITRLPVEFRFVPLPLERSRFLQVARASILLLELYSVEYVGLAYQLQSRFHERVGRQRRSSMLESTVAEQENEGRVLTELPVNVLNSPRTSVAGHVRKDYEKLGIISETKTGANSLKVKRRATAETENMFQRATETSRPGTTFVRTALTAQCLTARQRGHSRGRCGCRPQS